MTSAQEDVRNEKKSHDSHMRYHLEDWCLQEISQANAHQSFICLCQCDIATEVDYYKTLKWIVSVLVT